MAASRGTLAYRWGKLLRRHALAAAAVSIVVALVLAFAASMAAPRRRGEHQLLDPRPAFGGHERS